MANRLVVLFLSLLLAACDYQQRATGIVLDKDSKQPLADVRITKGFKGEAPEDNYVNNHSDKSGAFLVRYMGNGLFIPSLKLTFAKVGYQTAKVTLNAGSKNNTVYMERESEK